MRKNVKKFLAILKIELEDAEDGLECLLAAYKKSEEKNLITEYVSRENSGLARHEIAAIKSMLGEIVSLPAESFDSVEDAEDAVKEFVAEEIRRHGYPAALGVLIDRKILKIRKYIDGVV